METQTWTVSALHDAINDLFDHVFGEVVWVEGELTELKRSSAGHAYFRLVDTDDPATYPVSRRGNPATLAVTLFDSHRQNVNRFLRTQGDPIRMTDGVRVRIGGRLAVYPERSTVQLLMDRIDPAFTLGLLGQERARLIAALTAEGVLRANADRAVPAVPLHVGLVTSVGSAAHADVLHELESSGIGFLVSTFDARTQGIDAPQSVTSAVSSAAAIRVDVILVVRGGGAATDLAAFDHETVVRTIAGCGTPVWTGIGHETDRSVADEVAHTAHKTPTAAAAALVARVGEADQRITDDWASVRSGVTAALGRTEVRLGRVGRRVGTASVQRLDRHAADLDLRSVRVTTSSRRALVAADTAVGSAAGRVGPSANRVLERAAARREVLEATVRANDPVAAMRRGWSVTHTADGRLVRSSDDVASGEELVTTLAAGTVRSVVLEPTDGAGPSGPESNERGSNVG